MKKTKTKTKTKTKRKMKKPPGPCPLASSGMDMEEFCAIGECEDGDPQRLVSNLKVMIGRHLSPMLVEFLCDYLMKNKVRRRAGRPKKQENKRDSDLVWSFIRYRLRDGMTYQGAQTQVAEDHQCSEATVTRALKKDIFLRSLWQTRSRHKG